MHQSITELPQLRFEIIEAARILRMSRSTLYQRIRAGEIEAQKDGRRRYMAAAELQRYVLERDAWAIYDNSIRPSKLIGSCP